MRTKKIFFNSISSALLQMVLLFTGLILPRVYLTVYGSEMNGLLTSITQIISYFNLVEAGLGASLIYSLYAPLAEKNYESINRIVSTGKKYYLKTSYIYMLLVIGLSIIYPYLVKGTNIQVSTIIMLVLVIGFSGALEFFTMAKYRVLLTADQKLYVISLASIVSTIINFFILLILSYLRVDIVILRIAALSSLFVRSIIFKIYLEKNYPNISFNEKAEKIKKSLRVDALIYQFSITAHMSIPILVITFLCTLEEVSVYSIYNMVFVGIMGMLNIVTSGASSALGNIVASNQGKNLNKVFNEYELVIYTIISWLYGSAFILIMPFITVYTSGIEDINYINNAYGILFTIWGICNTTWMARASLISAKGLFSEVRKTNIIQMVGLIILGGILTSFYGIIGMLIALIIIASYRTIMIIYITNRFVLVNQFKITIHRIIRIVIILVITVLPFYKVIEINVTTLIDWVGYAIIVSIWAGIINIISLVIFEKNTFKSLIDRFSILLNKNK